MADERATSVAEYGFVDFAGKRFDPAAMLIDKQAEGGPTDDHNNADDESGGPGHHERGTCAGDHCARSRLSALDASKGLAAASMNKYKT